MSAGGKFVLTFAKNDLTLVKFYATILYLAQITVSDRSRNCACSFTLKSVGK